MSRLAPRELDLPTDRLSRLGRWFDRRFGAIALALAGSTALWMGGRVALAWWYGRL